MTMTRHNKVELQRAMSLEGKRLEEDPEDDVDVLATLRRSDPALGRLEASVTAFCDSLV